MNFESLKAGFKDYLIKLQAQKTGKSEAQVENEEFSASSTNIFLHEDEFKQYLAREVGQDVSIFSKSIDEIMEMQIVDGKLVDAKDEENKSNFDDEAKLEEAQSLQDSLVASMEAENSEGEAVEIPEDMMEGMGEFVTDDFNAMLQDEKVISTLDADGSGDLNIDEVGAFLGTINTDNDDKLSFEELSAGFTSIAEGKYQETYLESKSESAGNFINRVLDGIYEDEDVIKALDLDGDGKLNDDEKAKFEEFIKGYNSDGKELTEADIKRAYDDIKKGEFSYDADLNKKSEKINKEVKKESANRAKESKSSQRPSSASSSRGSGSADGAGRASGYNSFSGSSMGSTPNVENMSLEQLEKEKQEKQTEVDTAQKEATEAQSGENSEIKSAQEGLDAARDDYEKAVEEDENIEQELKDQNKENLEAIQEKEASINEIKGNISAKDAEISNLNATISSDEATLSGYEQALSSLQSFKSDDKSKQAEAQSKLSQVQSQISTLKAKIEEEKAQLTSLEEEKASLEEQLATEEEALAGLKEAQAEIDAQIAEQCGEQTKQAQEAMQEAQTQLDTTKTEVVEKTQQTLETAQAELDKVTTALNEKQTEEVKSENTVSDLDFNFGDNLTAQQQKDLELFKQNYKDNIDKYKAVEQATGIPAELVASIHWREGSGNFGTYLHNGQPLGQTTTIVPKGIYFDNWTDAAIDAMSKYGGGANSVDKDDLNSYLDYAERYNGLGYRNKGVKSPYVWSGTTEYTGGKYVKDGVYDPNYKDQQLGVAVMLKALMS